MTSRAFEFHVIFPIFVITSILIVSVCRLFDILEWSLPAIFGVAMIVVFIGTDKSKGIWQNPGMSNFAGGFGIMACVSVALFILLPDDRSAPTVEDLVANLWLNILKYLVILFVMVAGFGAIGWQLGTASRRLYSAGKRLSGITACFAAFVAWGIMLLLSSLWLSQSLPLVRAIEQSIE